MYEPMSYICSVVKVICININEELYNGDALTASVNYVKWNN